ncbi:MAG: hypothetical protein ACJ71Z_06880 [Aeromicrobium sp.]
MPVFAVLISLFATLFGPASDPECYALGGLDVARAEALADVNLTDLRAVYADRAAGAADARILRRYAARGYRIVGAGMVRGECRVIRRSAGQVKLDVTDRLASAWVVSEDGTARRLPRGALARHRIVLTGGAGAWKIASVG